MYIDMQSTIGKSGIDERRPVANSGLNLMIMMTA